MPFVFCDVQCILLGIVVLGILSGDVNSDETSTPSEDITVTTNPIFILSKQSNTENATLIWTARKNSLRSKFVTNIKVSCSNLQSGTLLNAEVPVRNNSKLIINLTGLTANTRYDCNATFVSVKKTELFEFTLETKPSETKSSRGLASSRTTEITPQLLNITATSALFEWSFTNFTDNINTTVLLTIHCSSNRNTSESFIFSTTSSMIQTNLTNLSPDTKYSCNASVLTGTNSSSLVTFEFETVIDHQNLELSLTAGDTFILVKWNQTGNLTYEIRVEELSANHFVPEECTQEKLEVFPENVTGGFYNYTKAFADHHYGINLIAFNNESKKTGEGSQNVTTETSAPDEVRNLHVDIDNVIKHNGSFSYNITWLIPCFSNGDITSYSIQLHGIYSENNSLVHTPTTITVPATPRRKSYNLVLDSLRPAHFYTVGVAAMSENFTGAWTYRNFTSPSHIPDPPIVTIVPQATTIDVEWSEANKMGEILSYMLEIQSLGPMYKRPHYCKPDNYNQKWTFPKSVTYYTINQLHPFTKYRISVGAETSEGIGEKTVIENVTLSQVPEAVENLNATYNNKTIGKNSIGMNISWTLPCSLNGQHTDTQVKLSGYSTEVHENHTKEFYVLQNTSLVVQLKYSFRYTITVWLIQANQQKGREADYSFTTPFGLPGKVSALNVSNQHDSFLIRWAPPRPEERRGPILKYRIDVKALKPAYEVDSGCNMTTNLTNYNSVTVSGTTTNYQFFLTPHYYHFYDYEILVRASTVMGFGDPEILTKTSLSSVPENVILDPVVIENEVSDEYTATAIISFKSSCFLNGPLENYSLNYEGTHEFKDSIDGHLSITSPYNFRLLPEYTYRYNITTFTKSFYNTTSYEQINAQAGVPKINIPVDKIPLEKSDSTAKLTLQADYFDQENGKVKYVALLLTNNSHTGGDANNYTKVNNFPVFSVEDEMKLKAIMQDPFYKDSKVQLVIGDASSCPKNATHCNEPLEPNRDYFLVVRAYTNNFYRNSPAIHFRTDELSKLDLILGILFGILFVVLAALIAFYLWRKKIIKIPQLVMIPTAIAARKNPEQNVALRTSYPPKKFINYFKHLENNPDIMKQQFAILKEKSAEFASTLKTHFAKIPENRRKNRYTNISPFDETRVKLMIEEDDEISSDYINASYIRGYTGEVEYIATQGPLESTCRDFWKMILQENVTMIVMVSLFIEQDKVKCHRYFPKNHETMMVGDDIEVKCSVELHFGIYCVRTLQVRKDNFQTHITHMQFLEWPDFGVPNGTDNMLQFCYQIRDRIEIEEGIIVVHCSAGVGRTGTLIATDILIQAANAGRNIDIYGTVQELRKQRMNMVQTEEQYIYIHKLLMEHLDRPQTLDSIKNQSPIYENQSIINSHQSAKKKKNPYEEEQESKF